MKKYVHMLEDDYDAIKNGVRSIKREFRSANIESMDDDVRNFTNLQIRAVTWALANLFEAMEKCENE